MLIVKATHDRSGGDLRKARRRKRLFVIFAIFSWTLIAFIAGGASHKTEFFGKVVRPWLEGGIRTPVNYVKGWMSEPKQLKIDINFENFEELKRQRDTAVKEKALFSGNNDYVAATLEHESDRWRVQLRLKGDNIDHLKHDKWSFRVRVKGDNAIFGMKQFSLHDPSTRNYIYEWLYHRALKREGIIALRYEFVHLTLNGKRLGIYALEEHFEKRLIENNKRREGPIIRFDENAMWKEIVSLSREFKDRTHTGSGSYLSSKIDGFQSRQSLSSKSTTGSYARAIHLLEGFRRGVLSTSEVFDVPLMARYFALVDLFGAEHGARWHNIRFYHNPVTSKFEPIGFDGNCGRNIKEVSAASRLDKGDHDNANTNANNFRARLFKDNIFLSAYLEQLNRVSQEKYVGELLKSLEEDLSEARSILYREWPHEPFEKLTVLYRNAKYIRTVLTPWQSVHVHFAGVSNRQVNLQVGNAQLFPVDIVGLMLPEYDKVLPIEDGPTRIAGKPLKRIVRYRTVSFSLPNGYDWSFERLKRIQLRCRLAGAKETRDVQVFPYEYQNNQRLIDPAHKRPNAHRFSWLVVNDERKTIRLKTGRHEIRENVVLPTGYTVIGEAGTTIDLLNKAAIVSYSPLQWVGTKEKPIRVISSDKSGQGLVVLQARGKSTLTYVQFDGLRYPDQNFWKLTGSVTFYESDVHADFCGFANNRSEDGLNILRSNFSLTNCEFKNITSDAFDADFCEGTISDSSFVNVHNDGIDVSGSTIQVKNVRIHKAGDKAISSGEESTLTADNIEIVECKVGLASKDLSDLTVNNARIDKCQYVFAAFRKKPEFGGARLKATNLRITESGERHLIEDGSHLTVDGQSHPPSATAEDIQRILYADEKVTTF